MIFCSFFQKKEKGKLSAWPGPAFLPLALAEQSSSTFLKQCASERPCEQQTQITPNQNNKFKNAKCLLITETSWISNKIMGIRMQYPQCLRMNVDDSRPDGFTLLSVTTSTNN